MKKKRMKNTDDGRQRQCWNCKKRAGAGLGIRATKREKLSAEGVGIEAPLGRGLPSPQKIFVFDRKMMHFAVV